MGRIIGRRVQQVNCPEEPGAGILPAGICEGGAGQPASLPRQSGPPDCETTGERLKLVKQKAERESQDGETTDY